MINKILVANRGEIAVRIIRAAHELGIKAVAVHSTADKDAMHVKMADESVCIGPASSTDSYLNKSAVISAALISGADAIHPGFGFLSENAGFVKMLEEHGIKFIGPSAKCISLMGDKIESKKTMKAAGIPTVPGSDGAITEIEEAIKISEKIGYPVAIKASAGGGGKGIKFAYDEKELKEFFKIAQTEALKSFGDDRVFIEKCLTHPKHIEIQVLADEHGNVVTLGERDCSLQRNRQKVLEEAPASTVPQEKCEEIEEIARSAAKAINYTSAGTFEFLYEDGNFYFMEMNTRIQVEHPVTEMVFETDIVREQIRIAAGEKLGYKQEDLVCKGHAIEFRINAEDPKTFFPSPGTITLYHPPGGPGIRLDSAVYSGYKIPPYYDSMIAKLIVYSPLGREDCIKRARRALKEFVIEGVKTTIPLHKKLLEQKDVQDFSYDNNWLDKFLKS